MEKRKGTVTFSRDPLCGGSLAGCRELSGNHSILTGKACNIVTPTAGDVGFNSCCGHLNKA